MTEIVSASIPDEQKEFVDNNDHISVSEILQAELEKRMKSQGDRRSQLKSQINETKNEIEGLEEVAEKKQAELEALKEELEQIEENEDDLVMEMVNICEAKITGNASYILDDSTITSDEAEACFKECVDRDGDETTEEVVAMLQNNGYSEESLNDMNVYEDDSNVDEQENEEAKELIKNTLTSQERDRVEEWVEDNL